jgi:glyoxylase-like metal-dependent hydrolase (beta-lactamase superfamily II)
MVDRPALAKALKLGDGQLIVFAQSIGFPKSGVAPKIANDQKGVDAWFTATPVAEGVFRIDDHGADNLYLVEGTAKALLIDTGLGVADVMTFVRALTRRPIVVVNTHGHPDHAGGNHQFAEVHAGRNDFELARSFNTPEQRASTATRMLKDAKVPEAALFRGPVKETRLVPVADGFVFDLGRRQLEVIDVPGHTRGGLVLLDRKQKLLFTGDNDNPQQWMFLEHSTPLETYLQTLLALERRSSEFDTLLPGHGGSLDKSFLGEQIACVRSILDGSCKGEPFHTFAGEGLVCRFKRAAIVYNPARLR